MLIGYDDIDALALDPVADEALVLDAGDADAEPEVDAVAGSVALRRSSKICPSGTHNGIVNYRRTPLHARSMLNLRTRDVVTRNVGQSGFSKNDKTVDAMSAQPQPAFPIKVVAEVPTEKKLPKLESNKAFQV
ncbi:hypothetical protein LMG29542_07695 [Paraburkholderia humisilvae]|uniref:Uncharacterized protein n=2 Tax=Paraburkholderia humisilvae TaxID=627669 RepID=A0A6J5FA35_9BURK|nr:hypothetical protein LMG29542_07695 [Paraburkholderia humisilvae]